MIIALFLWGGGQLIEVGDELALEYKNNRDGFFKVLLCKNLTKDWVAEYGVGGGIIILKIIGWSIFLFFTFQFSWFWAYYFDSDFQYSRSAQDSFLTRSVFTYLFLWIASFFYFRYSTKKKIKKKFIKRHNL